MNQRMAYDMLLRDTITLDELHDRLERNRQTTRDLIVMLDPDALRKYAPCSDEEFSRCPLRRGDPCGHFLGHNAA